MKSADQQPTTATTATATTATATTARQQKAFFGVLSPGNLTESPPENQIILECLSAAREPDRETDRESEKLGLFIGRQGTRQRTRRERMNGMDEWSG